MNPPTITIGAFETGLVAPVAPPELAAFERTHTDVLDVASLQNVGFRRLAEQAPEGILTINRLGITTYVNPRMAAILGRSRAEVIGRNVMEFALGESTSIARSALAAGLAGTTFQQEFHGTAPDGSDIWFTAAISPLRDVAGEVDGAVAVVYDNTALRSAELRAQRAAHHARALSAADRVLAHAESELELLRSMCAAVAEQGGYPLVWVGVEDAASVTGLRVAASSGKVDLLIGDGCVGAAPLAEQVRCAMATQRPQMLESRRPATGRGSPSQGSRAINNAAVVAIPLVFGGVVWGSLVVHADEHADFDDSRLQVLGEVANTLAFGLSAVQTREEGAKYLDQLGRALGSTVRAIANAAELRDPYTAGHQDHVSRLTRAIGEKLTLSEHEIHGIETAASIHDIGKIAVPAEILTYPGRLGTHQLELVKQHSRAGHDIVLDIEFPWPVPMMILQHHERLDGSGYPDGLSGDDVIFGARMIAVADVVDAISNHRPYRPALGIEAALSVVKEGSGPLFETAIVEACSAVFAEGHFRF